VEDRELSELKNTKKRAKDKRKEEKVLEATRRR
jgi:hypothetical protein